MKLLHNKFTEAVIMLPIAAFFIIASYYMYNSYSAYSHSKKLWSYGEYEYKLNSVLNALGEEQGDASIYLGTSGRSDFKQLEKQWKQTDSAISALETFVQGDPLYASKSSKLLEELKKLQDGRSKVSLLNINYIDSNLGEYGQRAKEMLLAAMDDTRQTVSSTNKEAGGLLDTYIDLGSAGENSSSERALVSFFLSRGKPIATDELEHWDQKIGKERAPDYTKLTQSSIKTKLDELLKTDKFNTLKSELFSKRISILEDSNSGNFNTDITEWYKIQSSKISLLNKSQHAIFDFLKHNIDTGLKSDKEKMTISAVVMLIALLLGFIVRNIFSGMARDAKNLENILKNIEIDSDLESEYNLKEMVSKQNKAEIYQFLEKIIQESKESKQLAEKANRTKSLFLANMSHEIRTPLNGIVGFTSLLRSSHLDSEQEEFVQIIEKSSENLISVINDILDISKIESENIDIEEISFDPIVEFESGIESYGAKASEKNIDLGFYIDPALSNNLKGDPTKIKQILVNLISNAVKFTPNGGNIDIAIEKLVGFKGETAVRFSVKDSGIGISPAKKEKIFEAFSQADINTTRKFGGTGLGLTISKRLTELMGGNLDLESEEGKGSTFFFTLNLEEIPSITDPQRFENISIGYYLPQNRKTKQSDKYVEKYIAALSGNCSIFNTIESLTSLKQEEQPTLLFVDFDHIDSKDLAPLGTLRSKISLLTTAHKKDEVKALNYDFFKTLYSPINFSKIKKTMLDLGDTDTYIIEEEKKNKFTDLKALVAEDNPINQSLIKRMLENMGITVTLADNGKKAYELRTTEVYDIIFMDIQMPIMGGVEATHAILGYEKKHNIPHIPIVALTANALKGDKERFLSEGMDHYISKPIEIDIIENILHQYFKEKLTMDNSTLDTHSIPEKESVDILLCKQKKGDLAIFDTLLQKIGYSVDKAANVEDLKAMLQSKNYRYLLLDKQLDGLSGNNEIHQILKGLNLPSVLFVDNLNYAMEQDRRDYTRVVLNIADMHFLRNIITKLNPRQYEKYSA
ncbi:MAG: ATP-binding protein [Campylobacterota bacterium]|nr:ATP-binding protein [Campylobacterota bacterium]